jgi:flagella basal body P-ring formation protein FlgA
MHAYIKKHKMTDFYMKKAPVLFLLVIFAISGNTYALMSTTELRNKVQNWVADSINKDEFAGKTVVMAQRLDSRIKLKDCDTLNYEKINHNLNQARFTVRVTCFAPHNWMVHVPVKIQRFQDVVSLTGPIKRGSIIQEQDVILTQRNVNKLTQGFFNNTADVIGKEARRSLSTGMALRPKWITEPVIIERGDRVSIIAKIQGLTVKAHGIAKDKGSKGQFIEVENLTSNRTIFAQIIDGSTVAIAL